MLWYNDCHEVLEILELDALRLLLPVDEWIPELEWLTDEPFFLLLSRLELSKLSCVPNWRFRPTWLAWLAWSGGPEEAIGTELTDSKGNVSKASSKIRMIPLWEISIGSTSDVGSG